MGIWSSDAMQKLGGIWLVVLAVALGFAAAPAAPASASAVQDVRTMKTLVNATRAQHGLPALRFTALLGRSAVLKAEAIRSCGSFSHTPCGAPMTRTFQQVGYLRVSTAIGENLGWGTGSLATPQAVLQSWLASPAHRANLLSARWREAGVSVVNAPSAFGATNVRIWVLQFGRRR